MAKFPGMTNFQQYTRYILLKNKLLTLKQGEGVAPSGNPPIPAVPKGAAMYPECRHIMTSGKKCQSPALSGKAYCYFHLRNRRPPPRQPIVSPDGVITTTYPVASVDLPVLEDRGAVQIAISNVLHALSCYQIDPRRAGLLLYGLQIASQNTKGDSTVAAYQSVCTLTLTDEGEELAPIEHALDLEDFPDDPEDEEDDEEDEDNDDYATAPPPPGI